MRKRLSLMAGLLVVAAASTAPAATDADKCAAAKMKAGAKYGSCRLLADAKANTKGVPVDYTKCDAKLSKAFDKADSKYGADCPTTGDRASVQTDMDEVLGCVATGLSGTADDCDLSGAQLCGNGVVDPGEVCDQGNLGGATCSSATAGVNNLGTLACGPDCTSFDTSGCIECPASDSAAINGQCWVLGAPGASCDGACGAAGMVYSPVTASIGEFGTLATCAYTLDALGGVADNIQTSGPLNGIGCNWLGVSFYLRPGTPTLSSDTYPGSRRACACQ